MEMAFKTAFVFESKAGGASSKRFLAPLAGLGYLPRHPSRGQVMQVDHEGFQVPMTLSEFDSWLEESEEASFQLWDGDADLYIRIRTLATYDVLEVGMNGNSEAERADLLVALEEYFRGSCRSGNGIAFVFDPCGVTEDFDWDSLVGDRRPFSLSQIPFGDLMVLLVSWWAADDGVEFGGPDKDGIINVRYGL